jgi:hypothetical protein
MTDITNEAVPVEWRETPLTLADRCDRGQCNAAALVRTFHKGVPAITDTPVTDLIWCAHHFAKADTKLASATLHIQDERPSLLASEKARLGKDVNYA